MIKEHYNNLIRIIRRWNEKRKLRKSYLKRLEVELLMEEWISKRILDGQTNRREELVSKQAEIKELELFIDFLK